VLNRGREYSGIPGSIHEKSDWSVQGAHVPVSSTKLSTIYYYRCAEYGG